MRKRFVASGAPWVSHHHCAATVEARIHEAAAYVPLERLTLSTQCGFASVEAGNPLTPEEQEAKLRLVVQIARRVWG